MKNKVAVVLSGSGVYDGSEINEAVLTFLQLETVGIEYDVFAQNKIQTHNINHLTGETNNNQRNILEESARIVRGNIKDLAAMNTEDYKGIVIVGGFGVAKNYSDVAFNKDFTIDPVLREILISFKNKVALYMCIAPVLASKIYYNAKLTVGNDNDFAKIISDNSCIHELCDQYNCIIDYDNKLITTPAYMLAENVAQANIGIKKSIQALDKLLNDH
ncbi:TPA: isoprenoid biosynthesis glyoxalase ElbB [Photobacterium damselae]